MADFASTKPTEAGATVTKRTGTASSDTVPAPCLLLINNTGAGSHNFDLTVNARWHGLTPASTGAPGKRRIVVGANAWVAAVVVAEMGDVNGRVGVAIDGTPGEISYLVVEKS